MLKKNFDILIA